MTIYLDAVWVLNFLLDFMLLMLTQALCREATSKSRLIFGAFFASLIVPLTLYFPNSYLTTVIGKLIYSILIILITFRFKTVNRMLKQWFIFYFVSFAIGGGLFALHYLLQNPIALSPVGFLSFNTGYGDPISWVFVVIGFPIVFWFTKNRMDKHAIEKIRYNEIYNVNITINNQSYSTTGYIDSGNQLVDPLTKRPVVICDEEFLQQWFTSKEWQSLKQAYNHFNIDDIPTNWVDLIQIVPFQGVEGKSNFLFSIKPDKIEIFYGEQRIISTKILIGIQFAELTKDNRYHCLLHPQIIQLATIHSA
ncbi:sigma-E processing peptidase SpoIIGA [Ornithinibacillus halotolerans]|uniref:Sporulation sigma-E factor-processing peptidase n=1 Tax=Ornithinibacillus halotolerans TaxID=1274357 RepID=A0A916WBU3_9BACI|nr:sigma-E processing peptidase SpoIIGA [Ornithinibacillus halotolerans]GGA83954.1 sporulation sigma-E factor-processing peptidase [Ornithinibacillus halotolerans]